MRDYTCDGVPVSQVPTDYLIECLAFGIEILDANDYKGDPVIAVKKRIELELFIRQNQIQV